MAHVVLGIGTSHGPMLVTETDLWGARVPADQQASHPWRGGSWTFPELVEARKPERLQQHITEDAWNERQARNHAAIERLADIFREEAIDVAVIVGNDQEEVFDKTLNPAFSVMYGEEISNLELPEERVARLPLGIAESIPGYIPQGGARSSGQPDLALSIIANAIEDGFDVATMSTFPKPVTPHAFGFVFRRIMRDAPVPTVPVLINTFYPPNQPGVRRCYQFGKSILKGIAAWDSDARVALIASGGLSHFVIDEELDRDFIDALSHADALRIERHGEVVFQGGTSEIKNWIPLCAAMDTLGFQAELVDYVPCYRSEAGTGNAMGFIAWRPE